MGNILGSAVAAACLSWGWGWAFLIPGAALAFTGVIIWLFLVVEPEEAGLMKMKDSLVVSHPHRHRWIGCSMQGLPLQPCTPAAPAKLRYHATLGRVMYLTSMHQLSVLDHFGKHLVSSTATTLQGSDIMP